MNEQPAKSSSKKRFRMTLLLWAAAVFLAVLGGCEWWLSRQPVFEGELVRDLVNEACKRDTDYDTATITVIGTPAIPYLVAKLKAGEPRLHRLWVKTYEHLPEIITGRLANPDYGYSPRAKAITYLGIFGTQAKTAVPEIIKLLSDTNEGILECATQALIQIGPDAKLALPRLEQLLASGSLDMDKQIRVARALWELGHETNIVLESYGRALVQTTNWHVHGPAFFGAQQIGEAALPMLKQLLSNATRTDRIAIARSIWEIDRDTNLVLQLYHSAIIQAADRRVLAGMAVMGPAAAPEIPELIRQMTDYQIDRNIRESIAILLGEIDCRNDDVIATLKAGMDSGRESSFSVSCADSLWKLDDQYCQFVVTSVTRKIAEHDEAGAVRGIGFLALLRAPRNDYDSVRDAFALLQGLTNSADLEIRLTAVDALKDIRRRYAGAMKQGVSK